MDSPKNKKVVTNFLRKLTNLSGRNRSVFFPRLIPEQSIDVQKMSQLNGKNAFTIIESLIANKKTIICPVVDTHAELTNQISAQLKTIQRTDQFIFEERGTQELHIGWPFVRGKFLDGTSVRCPLLFFPVTLKIENAKWVLDLRQEAEVVFNKSFVLAYSFYNQVKVDEGLMEQTFEERDFDSTKFRTDLYYLLKESTLTINFNVDLYCNELMPFTSFKKEEFETQHHVGELKLFSEAVLGIFSQTGSFLVPDYLHLLEDTSFNGLEEFFQSRTRSATRTSMWEHIRQIKEEQMYTVFPLDEWQENVLKAFKSGYSMVVQGPPGTGKSQLICNVISDAIAQGKKTLVVSQKRAALDVVFARLAEKNISEFVGVVHDFKNDRREIYQKLAHQIERIEEYQFDDHSKLTEIERQRISISQRTDQIIEELESFRTALFNEKDYAISIKKLYLLSDSTQPFINLSNECNQLKQTQILALNRKLKSYFFYAQKIDVKDYVWKERISFALCQASDRQMIENTIAELSDHFKHIQSDFWAEFNTELIGDRLEALVNKQEEISTLQELITTESRYQYVQKIVDINIEKADLDWLASMEGSVMKCYAGDGIESTLTLSQLSILQQALQYRIKALHNLFYSIYWRFFYKEKKIVDTTLAKNQLINSESGYHQLLQMVERRLKLEQFITQLKTKRWLVFIPTGLSKVEWERWFADQHSAIKVKSIICSTEEFKNILSPQNYSRQEIDKKLDKLHQVVSTWSIKYRDWTTYLSAVQIRSIVQQPTLAGLLQTALQEDFDWLVEFDKLKENLTDVEHSIIQKIVAKRNGIVDERTAILLFENSIYLAWIDRLEEKYPILKMASSGKLQLLEQELKELLIQKQELSNALLQLRVRQDLLHDMEFNRLNNRVTYRNLSHQVTKKKRIWPIRKVLIEFEEDVLKLIPCWLVSPDSVSAIFQMKEIFDVVIFDEASQCYAEQGIPALFRGRQVMVSGDSQQLKPSDFYQARWQDDDDEEPDNEVGSLLELCSRYLPSMKLQGHYRSKFPELIAFSNQHFYQGKLQMLPELKIVNQKEPAIEYVKVSGIWKNYTNEIEADRVVEIITMIQDTHPHKSIGVITFNAPQQSLILDKLEEQSWNSERQMPVSMFVKNIENVQGDERDIIVFSIGYAPDVEGKVSAQFGTLNISGGENRLNVAISRAREKIVIVTSLWPDQLSVEGTLNPGPKLLKAYLHYALEVSKGKFKITFPEFELVETHLKGKVYNWLKDQNIISETKTFPYCDLLIKQKQVMVGTVLTDDDLYSQRQSVKSSHALIPQLLESKNWPYIQLYSRNYWQDKKRFFNEIKAFLKKLGIMDAEN